MDKKILSIIIPMYNSENYIRKCLDSLLLPERQMACLDVLVVDDGSTDRGAEYVKEYVKKYPGSISMLQKQNGGHGSAVNAGVRRCRGKYFKVLDADDWVHTDVLQEMVHLLGEVDAQVVVCGYDRYDIGTRKTINISVISSGKETAHAHMLSETEGNAHIPARANGAEGADAGCADVVQAGVRYVCMQQSIKEWGSLRQLFCLHGLVYHTEFYRGLHYKLPEGVFYDDAFFFTVPCSHADKLCIIDRQLSVYRVGDTAQSVSTHNRTQRAGQLETVIRAIIRTGKRNACKMGAGREYWYRKLVSAVTDYYVTVFLRFPDRAQGRRMGRQFYNEIKKTDRKLYQRLGGRYCLLFAMHLLHRDEQDFEKLLNGIAVLRR